MLGGINGFDDRWGVECISDDDLTSLKFQSLQVTIHLQVSYLQRRVESVERQLWTYR